MPNTVCSKTVLCKCKCYVHTDATYKTTTHIILQVIMESNNLTCINFALALGAGRVLTLPAGAFITVALPLYLVVGICLCCGHCLNKWCVHGPEKKKTVLYQLTTHPRIQI